MSKFCTNCGGELNDDATFCEKCGARVGERQEQPKESPAVIAEEVPKQESAAQPEGGFAGKINAFVGKLKNKDKAAIGITAGVVAALILIVVLVICLSGSGPEKALDRYMDVFYYGKSSRIEKLAPKEYWDYLEENEDMDIEDAEDQVKTFYKTIIRGLEDEFGDDIKISYKVTEIDDVKKSTLDKMKDKIKSTYDIPKKDVTDAVEMEVEMTIKGDDDKDSDDITLYAVKIDGDWYICNASGTLLAAG